ncbi:hypothetical protein Q8F55_008212 [Vanrija albida]|uniref:Uncharacterized protein n=1 Tax=Vanrija albida TaxID=181172 RepID=A0ABR3PVM5_9TREE
MGKHTCPHSPACRDVAGTKMTAPEVVGALNTRRCRQDAVYARAVVCSYVEHKLGKKKSTSGVVFKLESLERCLPQYAETFLAVRAAYALPASRVLKGMGVRRRRLEPTVAVVRVAPAHDPELPAYTSADPDPGATDRLRAELAFWAEVESWGAVPPVVEESWGPPPAWGAQQLTNKLNVLEPRTSPAHKAAFAAVRRELSLPAYTPVSAARRPQMVSPEAEVAFVSYVGGAVERREARGEWVEIPYDSSDEEEEK